MGFCSVGTGVLQNAEDKLTVNANGKEVLSSLWDYCIETYTPFCVLCVGVCSSGKDVGLP